MKYSIEWLLDKYDRGESLKYIFFWGHTPKKSDDIGSFIFSQWYPAPFAIDGVEYKTAEHWMMAEKAKLFGNDVLVEEIIKSEKPAVAKELGRRIQGFEPAKWDTVKFNAVVRGNVEKFKQNDKLKDYLLKSGDQVLVEAAPNDPVWGIGISKDTKDIENPHTWKGTNLLGFALMEARDLIRSF